MRQFFKVISYLLFLFFIFRPSYSLQAQDDLKTKYFFEAVKKSDTSKINLYLKRDFDINTVFLDEANYKGATFNSRLSRNALIVALENKELSMVKFLVHNGADVNQTIEVGWFDDCTECPRRRDYSRPKKRFSESYTPIKWAIQWGNIEAIDFLIQNGARYKTEIETIKKTGKGKIVEYFEKLGMELNFSSDDFETIYEKIYYNGKAFAHYLLESGVKPNPASIFKMIERKDTTTLNIALKNGADVNAYYQDGALKICPLCKAVLMCDLDITKILVEDYMVKLEPVCTFYTGGSTNMSRVTPLQIAKSKYLGKCKGRNDTLLEYLLFAKDIQKEKMETVNSKDSN